MHEVWFLFKFYETVLGLICLGLHIQGFLQVNPDINCFYAIVFVAMPLTAMFGNVNICMGVVPTSGWEAGQNLIFSCIYFAASVMTMQFAETNFFLEYLDMALENADKFMTSEEYVADKIYKDVSNDVPLHPFFLYSKAQSITALILATLYLLHSFLAFDVVIFDPDYSNITATRAIDREVSKPLKLYVIGKDVHIYLERYEWFRNFLRKQGRVSASAGNFSVFNA